MTKQNKTTHKTYVRLGNKRGNSSY